jgi:hypothetical protein
MGIWLIVIGSVGLLLSLGAVILQFKGGMRPAKGTPEYFTLPRFGKAALYLTLGSLIFAQVGLILSAIGSIG